VAADHETTTAARKEELAVIAEARKISVRPAAIRSAR